LLGCYQLEASIRRHWNRIMLSNSLRSLFSLIGFAGLLLFISSCKTDDAAPDPLAILTGKVWAMDEIRYLQNNTNAYYKRGGSTNTVNFDDAIIKFNRDGTGTTNWQGNSISFVWSFVSNDRTKVALTLSTGSIRLINWDNMTFSESAITYTETYNNSGTNSLAQAKRTPRL
jgi:hypothetical protein